MIDEKKIKEAARIHATGNMLYECHKEAFEQGAKWALEQQSIEIYNALKGLGLEKHSIALNVLKITGIKVKDQDNNK